MFTSIIFSTNLREIQDFHFVVKQVVLIKRQKVSNHNNIDIISAPDGFNHFHDISESFC